METGSDTLNPNIFISIAESSREAVVLTNWGGETVYVNQAFCQLFGVSVAEGKERGFNSFFDESARKLYGEKILPEINEGRVWRGELQMFTLKKTPITVWALTAPVTDGDGKHYIVSFLHNMADRKRIEDALYQSENRYRMLFEYMTSGVAILESTDNGKDFLFRDINQAGQWLDGVERSQVLGKRITELFPGTLENGMLETICRVWRFEEPAHFPFSVYENGKNFGWRENWIYKLPSGEIVILYEELHDWKSIQRKLVQSEERNKALLQAVPDMIFRHSRDGTTLDFKPGKYIDPFVPPEKFIGKKLQDILPSDVSDLILRTIGQVLKTNDLHTIEYSLLFQGEIHRYEGRMVASGKDEVVFIVRDITGGSDA